LISEPAVPIGRVKEHSYDISWIEVSFSVTQNVVKSVTQGSHSVRLTVSHFSGSISAPGTMMNIPASDRLPPVTDFTAVYVSID
jgi:hypothetical protein